MTTNLSTASLSITNWFRLLQINP